MALRRGLLDDTGLAEIAAVAAGPVNVRLIIDEVAQPCHCCTGARPLIVAVWPDDPSLPEGLGEALTRSGRGVALATLGADHLAGTALVAEGATFPIHAAPVICDGTPLLVIHLSDVTAFLPGATGIVTVAALRMRPNTSLPAGWIRAADMAGPVPVSIGWTARAPAGA